VSPGTSELLLLNLALRRNRGVLRLTLSIRLFQQDSISILIDNRHLPNRKYAKALGGLTKLGNKFKHIPSQIMCVRFILLCLYVAMLCVLVAVVVSSYP
jgi:hypothetical protein